MARSKMRWVVMLGCLALGGCTADRVELLVDLRTDFVAGHEFVTVDAALLRAGEDSGEDERRDVTEGDTVGEGLRIAEFAGLKKGRYELMVQLKDASGLVVVERPVELELRESFAVTVLITRDCRDVMCDDPAARACLQGVCVPETCTPETPESCPMPGCESVRDCALSPAECAEAVCEDRACLLAPVLPAQCTEGLYCDPDLGCRASPTAGTPDAGTPDAGTLDAGALDADTLDGGSTAVDAGPPPATCWNGVRDGDETQADCGGSCPTRCSMRYDCAAQADIPPSECWALIALYESTNGDGWEAKLGWFTVAPCGWYGVTCAWDHVDEIFLASNNLSGPIPVELKNLANLTGLWLGTNQLVGRIPAELGNLSNLRQLWLDDNGLGGGIPPELGNLTLVATFELSMNMLSGELPPALMSIPATNRFRLRGNACLTATGATFLSWLADKDALWNDGCG